MWVSEKQQQSLFHRTLIYVYMFLSTWFYYHFWEVYSVLYMLKARPESVSGLSLRTMIYLYFHNYSLIFNFSLSLILLCMQIWTESLWGDDKIFGFILAFILPRSTLDSNSLSFGPGPPLLPFPLSAIPVRICLLMLNFLPFTQHWTTCLLGNILSRH